MGLRRSKCWENGAAFDFAPQSQHNHPSGGFRSTACFRNDQFVASHIVWEIRMHLPLHICTSLLFMVVQLEANYLVVLLLLMQVCGNFVHALSLNNRLYLLSSFMIYMAIQHENLMLSTRRWSSKVLSSCITYQFHFTCNLALSFYTTCQKGHKNFISWRKRIVLRLGILFPAQAVSQESSLCTSPILSLSDNFLTSRSWCVKIGHPQIKPVQFMRTITLSLR